MSDTERLERIRQRLRPFVEDHHAATIPAKYADWLADRAFLLSALEAERREHEETKRERDIAERNAKDWYDLRVIADERVLEWERARIAAENERDAERAKREEAEAQLKAEAALVENMELEWMKRFRELEARALSARREALEEAAKQADATEASVQNLLDRGKGEWPTDNYVTDDIWASWRGQAMAARDIARRIRTLSTPTPVKGEKEET